MKPFNLQEALAGKPVVTRDGRKVAQVVHFPKVSSPVWRVVGAIDGGAALPVSEEGAYFDNDESPNDFFMASEKKEGWINVYSGDPEAYIYPTQKEADLGRCGGRVACVRIEWEE